METFWILISELNLKDDGFQVVSRGISSNLPSSIRRQGQVDKGCSHNNTCSDSLRAFSSPFAPNLPYSPFLVVLGLCGKVLVVVGLQEKASVKSCQKLPPTLTEPVPASSKLDLPQNKAKPTRGVSNIFMGGERKEKEVDAVFSGNSGQRRAEWKYMRETTVQTPGSVNRDSSPWGRRVAEAMWWTHCSPISHQVPVLLRGRILRIKNKINPRT